MVEKHYDGNLYLLPEPSEKDACIVTTNGIVKKNGRAVMGAGTAKYCRDTFLGVDRMLAGKLKSGNHCYLLGKYPIPDSSGTFLLYSFPTKNDWKDKSDIRLIRQSCKEMKRLADEAGLHRIYMSCPGCGCGGLDYYQDVRPILMVELDERFIVCMPDNIWRKGIS